MATSAAHARPELSKTESWKLTLGTWCVADHPSDDGAYVGIARDECGENEATLTIGENGYTWERDLFFRQFAFPRDALMQFIHAFAGSNFITNIAESNFRYTQVKLSCFRRLGLSNCSHGRIYSASISLSLVLISGLSRKTMFNKELWTSSFPLYSIKPQFAEFVHEKTYA